MRIPKGSCQGAEVTDGGGGRVFIRGELCNAWDAADDLGRRLAAVQLVRINAATFRNGTLPAGVRGRGGWAVITPTNSTPKPVEHANLFIAAEGSQT